MNNVRNAADANMLLWRNETEQHMRKQGKRIILVEEGSEEARAAAEEAWAISVGDKEGEKQCNAMHSLRPSTTRVHIPTQHMSFLN